jgi:hypothetical protein
VATSLEERLMSGLADHEYNPGQPMNDTGDLATDLLNTGKDVGSIGGVETGRYPAVNEPEQREPGS